MLLTHPLRPRLRTADSGDIAATAPALTGCTDDSGAIANAVVTPPPCTIAGTDDTTVETSLVIASIDVSGRGPASPSRSPNGQNP